MQLAPGRRMPPGRRAGPPRRGPDPSHRPGVGVRWGRRSTSIGRSCKRIVGNSTISLATQHEIPVRRIRKPRPVRDHRVAGCPCPRRRPGPRRPAGNWRHVDIGSEVSRARRPATNTRFRSSPRASHRHGSWTSRKMECSLSRNEGADRIVALPDRDGDAPVPSRRSRIGSAASDPRIRWPRPRRQPARCGRDAALPSGVGRRPSGGGSLRRAGGPDHRRRSTRTITVLPDGQLLLSAGSTCNVCAEDDPRRAAINLLRGSQRVARAGST